MQRTEYQEGVLAANEAILQHKGVLLVYLIHSILSKLVYLVQSGQVFLEHLIGAQILKTSDDSFS